MNDMDMEGFENWLMRRQSSRAQGDAEPVAWWDGDTGEPETAFQFERDNIYEIPVFTHPPKAQAVPENWKLVPIVPTKSMQYAWDIAPTNECADQEFIDAYQAMLDAAPQPPQENNQ